MNLADGEVAICQCNCTGNMHDSSFAKVDLTKVDHRLPSEVLAPDVMPPKAGYILGNSDAGLLAQTSDSLMRS